MSLPWHRHHSAHLLASRHNLFEAADAKLGVSSCAYLLAALTSWMGNAALTAAWSLAALHFNCCSSDACQGVLCTARYAAAYICLLTSISLCTLHSFEHKQVRVLLALPCLQAHVLASDILSAAQFALFVSPYLTSYILCAA